MLSRRLRRAAGADVTVVFVASDESSGSTVPLPAGVLEGDFLVMVDVAGRVGGSSVTAVTPAGWTNQVNLASSAYSHQRMMVHTKIAGAAEAGPYTGMNDTGERKAVLAFRRSASITTVTPSAITFQESVSGSFSQSVNYSSVKGTSVTIGLRACYHGDSLISWSGSGWTAGGQVAVNGDLHVQYSPNDAEGNTGLVGIIADTGSINQILLINFKLT
jgi:hypothetical protein